LESLKFCVTQFAETDDISQNFVKMTKTDQNFVQQIPCFGSYILNDLSVLKFDDLFEMNALTFMEKYHYGKLLVSFNNKFTPLMGSNRTVGNKINVSKNKG